MRVCVPLNERTLSTLASACVAASDVADIIELRLDGLEPGELSPSKINHLINSLPRPVILTLRPSEQGGYRSLTIQERITNWRDLFNTDAAFFDIESDLVSELVTHEDQPDWSRVISSHHDFNDTPDNLDSIYEQLAFSPARILKLAVQASDVVDCLDVFKLLDRAKSEERETIVIAMGNAGILTRIVGPMRGSFLTYGSLENEKGTAPGQIVAQDLKSLYHIDEIDSETLVTGIVGLPVMHSVSPHMHNAAFKYAHLNGVYVPLEVRNLAQFFKRMVDLRTRELNWKLRGLSITAPYKVEVMDHLDWIDPRAKAIGAVNTVLLENEQLLGYNTDADGLIDPLISRVGALDGLQVAVIGAGGAANAAIFALLERHAEVTLYVRNVEKGRSLAERFNIPCEQLTPATFAAKDVVINTTPLGSLGQYISETPVSSEQLRGSRFAYDLVYNPVETLFMREARAAGCEVLGGLEMLVAQAVQQFKLFTQTTVLSELMYSAALRALER